MEGYNHALTQDKVYLTVLEEAREVTRAIMHKALNLVGGVHKIPKDNATGLLAIVGNAAKGHEGYPVVQCIATYRLPIAALMERLCFCKKYLYASATLAETMAAAEKVHDNFDWTRFIMGNLRRQLTTTHNKESQGVQGIELMDTILQKWYPHNKRIIEP